MELRNLKAFVEVVRQGGFSRAADAIHATQSTVSKSVRALEEELGLPLLERLGRKSRLTAAGEIVYRRALALLAERDHLVGELAALRGLEGGVLSLGLPPIGSSTLFAPLFAIYRRRYPAIEIRLVEHGGRRLEEMLRAGELELAAFLLPASDEFAWQEVRREPIDALVAADHPLAERKSAALAALAASPFILYEAGFALNAILLDACRRAGVEPVIAARSSQMDFIVTLAAAGLGVAFLPRMLAETRVRPDVRRLAIADLGADWHMALFWRRGAYLSHAAQAWLSLAKEKRTALSREASGRTPRR